MTLLANISGRAIRCALFFWLALLTGNAMAQTYNMASGTVNTCSGTFYDPGGAAGNYGNSLNVTQTFCSSAGNCISFNFTSFSTQAGNDILTVYDGPNTASPVIGTFSGGTSPGTITASSGCITFNFVSNGSNNRAGWAATISCTSCGTNVLMNSTATVNTCGGLLFDDGGSAGNYAANQNFTRTICSNSAGCLQLVFSNFTVKTGDFLTIWDGPSTASTLIGSFDGGTGIPPVILGTSGCLTIQWVTNANQQDVGFQAVISCEPCPIPPAATANYLSPTSGLQNALVGANMVNTCGATFADNGGTAGNYSNSLNGYYRTFCPNIAGNCMRATFWSVDIQPPGGAFYTDLLRVLNGPTQNSTVIDNITGTFNSYQACMAAGIGPYISTDQSGCLGFRFWSDATTPRAGWVVTLDCVPCPNGPNGTDNSDCRTPTAICTDQSFTDASTGPGIVSDGGGGCVISENFSNWYKILVSSSGTLGLQIVPNVTADDYDFALYSASDCASLGSPVRCSYAANTGTTGMNSAQNLTVNTAICGPANNGSDLIEDVCGNGWTNDIAVTAGQTYYLLVNKWSPGGSGFTLDWVVASGASLNCAVLPVELMRFTAEPNGDIVDLTWTTASETNNDYFTVERSRDGENFEPIQRVNGAGTISYERTYLTIDPQPLKGVSYYRLKQTDFDGKYTYSETVAVKFGNRSGAFELFPNPAGDKVSVIFNETVREDRTLRITDMSGREVFRTRFGIADAVSSYTADVSGLSKGVYFVSLESEQGVTTQRLLLQ